MTVFYIIRHGQTLFNERDRVQGWCDSPLTEQGVSQTKALAQGLKDVPFAAIYTSPLERAKRTAQVLAEPHPSAKVVSLDSLREVSYGTLEGEYIRDAFPQGDLDPIGYSRWCGEDIYKAQERFISQLRMISVEHPDEEVAVVSHGHIIKLLLGALDTKFKAEDIRTANRIPCCSVTKVGLEDNHFSLLAEPDISWRF